METFLDGEPPAAEKTSAVQSRKGVDTLSLQETSSLEYSSEDLRRGPAPQRAGSGAVGAGGGCAP